MTDREAHPLACMLEARSVAVIGASARPGSFGEQMLLQLMGGGFEGAVYPVTPKYDEVMGLTAYPAIGDLPERVDLAILGVSNAMLEDQLRGAAEAGARSAVIFASCHEDPVEGEPPLTERLASIARGAGMTLCGGNGMGFVNMDHRLRACGFSEPLDREPGSITFVTHSGSVFSAFLHNDRGLRFNLVVSSGLELVTTAADYLTYALERPTTRVIGLFIETARDPSAFRQALSRAADADIPLVALKVGQTDRSKELVQAHSGALAGENGAYEALFDAYGVSSVQTLDELADTLELFAAGRRATSGGLASIHDSGGERAHLIDLAAQLKVPLAQLSKETVKRLGGVLEPGLPATNPLDAWGTGNAADDIFLECMRALLDDPDTGALAFTVDLTTEEDSDAGYGKVAIEAFASTDKPFGVMSNLASSVDREDAEEVRDAGIPVLEGTSTGLLAFRHLFDRRDFKALPIVTGPHVVPKNGLEKWRGLLTGTQRSDVQILLLLADNYGIPSVDPDLATDADAAVEAAERIGWPVALKTARDGILHKSDVGGVVLDVPDAEALRVAYADLAERLGPVVAVAAMAPPGVELHLGIVNDSQFGPLVMIGAGGVLVEVLGDRRLALPPLDRARARRMIDHLAVRPLLDGVRGQPPVDIDAVADALVKLSWLAVDFGDLFEAFELNPLIARPDGCVAVDGLLIRKRDVE
jgi:acetate---CoA ligase (ADP-forming)